MIAEDMRWQPFRKEVKRNPYPHYKYHRAATPILKHFPFTYILDYQSVVEVLKNSDDFSSAIHPPELDVDISTFRGLIKNILFQHDGQSHKDLRAIGMKGLKGIEIASIIDQETKGLQMELASANSLDFIVQFSIPLSVRVICRIFGISIDHQERLKDWGQRLFKIAGMYVGTSDFEILEQSATELKSFVHAIIENNQYQSGYFIANIMMNRDPIENDDEAIKIIESWIFLLVFTSMETSSGAIGNSIYHLLDNDDQLNKLRKAPSLLNSAVEELLRFDTPLQFVSRSMANDYTINGVELKAKQMVTVCLGSANRDEDVFEDPDVLKIDRKPNLHVSFGQGTHYCFGARIARMEIYYTLKNFLLKEETLSLSTKGHTMHSINVLKSFSSLWLNK